MRLAAASLRWLHGVWRSACALLVAMDASPFDHVDDRLRQLEGAIFGEGRQGGPNGGLAEVQPAAALTRATSLSETRR
ncbi:hypothetical protein ACVW17_001259 [Bradyrhizobium sp. USDA 4473]